MCEELTLSRMRPDAIDLAEFLDYNDAVKSKEKCS